MSQNRVVGPFLGNMERNPPNYGTHSPWQPSGIPTDGCYPNQMSGVWVSEAAHQLDRERNMHIASHTLAQLKTAPNIQQNAQGLHSTHSAYGAYSALLGLHDHGSTSAEHVAHRMHSGLAVHGGHPSSAHHRVENGFATNTASQAVENMSREQPVIETLRTPKEIPRNHKSMLLSRHSKESQQAGRTDEHVARKNIHRADTNNMPQNMSCSASSGQESKSSDGEPGHSQINAAASENWKDFLVGLRTGNYDMPDSFRHHMDPDAPVPLPDDIGKSDDEREGQSSSSKTPKMTTQQRKMKLLEAKEALNKGQEHVNIKGKVIRARRMGDGCASKGCRFKCEERISKEARTNIFNYFWNLGNHQLQWLFIAMHTSVRAPKQRTQDPVRSRRKTSRSYFFRQGTGKIPVCKTMFLQTLDVSDSWVDTAISKAANGVAVAPDCRGRHSKKMLDPSAPVEKKKRKRKKKNKSDPSQPEAPGTQGSQPRAAQLSLHGGPNKLHYSAHKLADSAQSRGSELNLSHSAMEANDPSGAHVGNNMERLETNPQDGGDCTQSELDLLRPRIDLRVGVEADAYASCSWAGVEAATSSSGAISSTSSVITSTPGSLAGLLPGSSFLTNPEASIWTPDQPPPPPPPQKKRKRADVSAALHASARGLGVGIGVGGLLGAAGVAPQFRHLLDPHTMGLKGLPNGAVLTPVVERPRQREPKADDDASASSSASTSAGTGKKSKKKARAREPKKWRANQAKEALNTGKEHVNLKGKLVRARRMREGCGDSCRFRCRDRIGPLDREAIFSHFWSLGDHKLQWLFISRHTRVREPKHRTTNVDPALARRKTSRSYFFTVFRPDLSPPTLAKRCRIPQDEAIEIPVCKTMFLHTLDVSDSWVESAIAKVHLQGASDGVVEDQRGRHGKRTRRLPAQVVDSVRQHMALFPRSELPVPAGACGGGAKGLQRPSHGPNHGPNHGPSPADGLSVSKMHRLYLEWLQEQGIVITLPATLRQYRDIFAAELRSEFKIPKPEENGPNDEGYEVEYDGGIEEMEFDERGEGEEYDERQYLADCLQPRCELIKTEPEAMGDWNNC